MATQYSPKIVTDGLVLMLDAANPKSYPGSGTTWRDLSGNGNNGSMVNTTYNSGYINFDGTAYVNVTSVLNSESIGASTTKTISFWFYRTTYSSTMPFSTGQTGDDRIYFWNDSSLHTWRVGNYTSLSGHSTLIPSTWYYTTLVIDGTTVYAYLNGELDYSGTYAAFTTADWVVFGRHGNTATYIYNGRIACATIYNKSLSQTEILQNYNATKGRFV